MRWPKRIRWPWRRRTRPSAPKRTAEALRNLYFDYLKQKRMWGYSVISSMMLMCLFISMSLFADTNFWVLAIPVTAIVFSFFKIVITVIYKTYLFSVVIYKTCLFSVSYSLVLLSSRIVPSNR